MTVLALSDTSFRLNGLGPLTGLAGNYVLSVDASLVKDLEGKAGLGSASVAWSAITTGPVILSIEQLATNPRNIVVMSLDVAFSHPIDPASFDYQDVTLTLNGGPNLITSDVTVTPLTSTNYRIANFNWVVGYPGSYTLTVDATAITDLAGNSGSDSASETWQMVTETPASPANLLISPDLGISSTDGLTCSNVITLSGTVASTNLTVRVQDQTTGTDLGTATLNGTNFSAVLTFTGGGQHHLKTTAVDAAANVSAATYFDLFLDLAAPTASIQDLSTNSIFGRDQPARDLLESHQHQHHRRHQLRGHVQREQRLYAHVDLYLHERVFGRQPRRVHHPARNLSGELEPKRHPRLRRQY